MRGGRNGYSYNSFENCTHSFRGLLGSLATAGAMIIGFGIIVPTGRRMAGIAAGFEGGPPTPEKAQELQGMSDRIRTLTRINSIVLAFATVTMAAARFI